MSDVESRLAALEAEVRTLRDHLAIGQLVARYGPLADGADTTARNLKVGALWADEGVYELASGWTGTGPQGVADLLDNDVHRGLVGDGAAHIMSAPYVRVSGDSAVAVNYSRVYKHEDGRFIVWRMAANLWELARVGGDWKVMRRTNRMLDGSEEARALLRNAYDAE